MYHDELYLKENSKLLVSETNKLKKIIAELSTKTEFPIGEIIPAYHQVITVNSLIELLKNTISDQNSEIQRLQTKIEESQYTRDDFNARLHSKILAFLELSIKESMATLKSRKKQEKTKEIIEKDAKLYEQLRKKMSTKEFVEQYGKGLKND